MDDISLNVLDDTFIHFTYAERAKEIVADGVISANPKYKKFGIAGVQAVSLKHGQYVPAVQVTHLSDPEQEIVAVLFKTGDKPRVGYPEEVIWDDDVHLLSSKIISKQKAEKMLLAVDGRDYTIRYESLVEHLLNKYS